MEAFSQKDYYPVPSENVITYVEGLRDQSKKRQVSKSDLPALIVHLSSPIDAVDYMVISDFFLIYRNFISPMELSDLLIMRFRWCVNEIVSESVEKRKIGEIALVRTFVLLRHWILNYFVNNFLPDENLRLRVIKFLNEPCDSHPKIVRSTIVNLKKAWIVCCLRVWTNLSLNEPPFKGSDERWVTYKIVDYTKLDSERKRNSRLSAYAKNGSSSPNFRNQSVLSLYKDSMVFKIPELNDRASRTASMVLFPCDNSNIKVEMTDDVKPEVSAPRGIDNKRVVSTVSKVTDISNMIKDVKGSVTPGIDKVLPPTPARKVELVLRVPDEINADKMDSEDTIKDLSDSSQKHLGPIALLQRWKKNHIASKISRRYSQLSPDSEMVMKPEVENFVKYVISITALENKAPESDNLNDLVASKFDILSARTVEEVEFLVSLENELLNQVKNAKDSRTPANNSVQDLQKVVTNDQGFSAMDNLNLYHTVSSIAKSVTSLTNSLNQRPKGQTNMLSPSHAALERRKVQSSMAAMLGSSSRYSLISRNNSGKTTATNHAEDGPQRLVFHDVSYTSQEKEKKNDNLSFRENRTQSPTRSSPLRNNLPCLVEDPIFSSRLADLERNSIVSISTCSQLSSSSPKKSDDESLLSGPGEAIDHGLKRKEAQSNLREFTFESRQEDDVKNRESVSSFVTTRDTIEEGDRNSKFSAKGVRPASGRISLIRKPSTVARTVQRPKTETAANDLDFLEKDEELLQSERELIQLQRQTAIRLSMAASVNTDILFASQKNSPIKMIAEEDNSNNKLSATPSMRSLNRRNSESTKMTSESLEESADFPAHSSLKDELRRLEPELSVESSFGFPDLNGTDPFSEGDNSTGMKNKYLFSPDGESADLASPAKNVEELKDKFLNKEQEDNAEDSQLHVSTDTPNDLTQEAEEAILELKKKALDQENVVNIASLPDDSVHDDPVNVALMKLEGTYKKGSGQEEVEDGSSSRPVSALAKEAEVLGIKGLGVSQLSPADKRRSLLIEKRRQTVMNFPFTPTADAETQEPPASAKDLLNSYELKDPSLLITNSAQHVPFILMYDSVSIAQQMTLIEREILGEVDWNELLNLNLTHSAPHATSWLQLLVQNESLSGINLAICRFNLTVDWVISEIVLTSDVKLRRNTIQRFIHVAEHCRNFQNYNTMMEIVLALGSTAVQKSSEAWRLIEPGDLITWEELKKIPSLDRNYSIIRNLLNNVDPLKGCVPFIVIYLSDISLNSEKKSWIVLNQVVNYNKFNTNVQIVKNFIQRVQWSKFYDFTVDHELLSKCVYLSALSQDEIKQLTS